MNSIRVIQFGLGPIGCASAQAILEKKGLELVGAVDIAPDKAGKDLASVLGFKGDLGIRVHPDAAELFLKVKADVVVHTTGSYFKDVYPQLAVAATAGLNIVSSAEELLFPQLRNPALAD